jgi:hypothetical protein
MVKHRAQQYQTLVGEKGVFLRARYSELSAKTLYNASIASVIGRWEDALYRSRIRTFYVVACNLSFVHIDSRQFHSEMNALIPVLSGKTFNQTVDVWDKNGVNKFKRRTWARTMPAMIG